ncbi:Rieske (2Fe-2S) protein [Salinadaptatus halalkaliphilus]|uniref:Rieske (2Fe-2S) protein n=1 Tax=Salinadaptatus halalkaliphilus TaxID=2419781 RepID=A0A4S3TJL4_9EURY|nr:Rieske 2Fe-2S domain-containing protein [Salinadaptatus halalkaliphilus]THE64186.1 Rieske (2Fe-2S) protein [Salinadaptatus halalkaliphilus]
MCGRHKVTDEAAIADPGERVLTEVKGVEIAVFNVDGDYHALANFCPHQSGPLCEGPTQGRVTVDDDLEWAYDDEERNVVCPWHGWIFDVTTGTNIDAEQYTVPTYDIEVEDGEVFIVI